LGEIINMVKNDEEEAFLITLDAQKAFDSVDHDYLIRILRVYNFPETYIKWVKTIYTNLESSVLVNGYTTSKFKIEQSVKQGDALSCALFILAIEPLLNRIQKNEKITPVIVKSLNPLTNEIEVVELKKSGFADDITCLTKDKNSLQEIITEYERFSRYSGIHLNVAKTEVLIIGKKANEPIRFDLQHGGKTVTIVDQEAVKICGIVYSNDNEKAYDKNIKEKIDKLKNQLQLRRQRNLTLEGKIIIVKTFGLSQLIYALQSTYIKDSDLELIDLIITKFIWNLKEGNNRPVGKIKKSVLRDSIANGGLNAPDIFALDKAIKYKSILMATITDHPIKVVYNKYYAEVGYDFVNYTCNTIEHNFLGKAISVHIGNAKRIHNDIKAFVNDNDGIHKNYYSYVQNKSIIKNEFVNLRQNSMITRLLIHNIKNLQGLHVQKSTNGLRNLFFDVHQVYNTFPIEWRKLLNNTRREHPPITGEVYIGLNKWTLIRNITLKCLAESLRQKDAFEFNDFLSNKHTSIRVDRLLNNPFIVLRKTIKDVKLRNLNYKMYHNIYPTMAHLFKWKIKESENCSRCGCKETLRHAIYDCTIAESAIMNLKSVIKLRYKISVEFELSYENILFGLSSTRNSLKLRVRQKTAIDQVIVLLKQRLILQRENKANISNIDINDIFEERKNIAKYIAIKNRKHFDSLMWENC